MSVSRKEAGLVEKNFKPQSNDEVVSSGEYGEHLEENAEFNEGSVILNAPSALNNPTMSPEEQNMQMEATIVGPPQYGSPDPTTSAGKLVPLNDHPLNNLPDGHPAAISESYGAGVGTTLEPGEFSHHGEPQRTDLESDSVDVGSYGVEDYETMKVKELKKLASRRGIQGYSGMNQDELIDAHIAYDEAQSEDSSDDAS